MPWWLRPALGAVAVGGLLGVATHYRGEAYKQGFNDATEQRAAKDADEREAMRQREAVAADEQHTAAVARQKERVDHEKTIADLRAAARRGAVIMRVAGPACPPTTAAGGPGDEAGRQLMPETAADILDIAAGIRQSVLDYNALIDACTIRTAP